MERHSVTCGLRDFLVEAIALGPEIIDALHAELHSGDDSTAALLSQRAGATVRRSRQWSYSRWWNHLYKPNPSTPWAEIPPETTLEEVICVAVRDDLAQRSRRGWDRVSPHLRALSDVEWQLALSGVLDSWDTVAAAARHRDR